MKIEKFALRYSKEHPNEENRRKFVRIYNIHPLVYDASCFMLSIQNDKLFSCIELAQDFIRQIDEDEINIVPITIEYPNEDKFSVHYVRPHNSSTR